MAFTSSNVRREQAGSVNCLVGDWTGSAGDSAGTITVGGGRIYSAFFYDQSATTAAEVPFPFTVTTSGANSTITVNYPGPVTAGRFIVFFK